MSVKLLAEHHLEFLCLKGGCTGSSESTHVKMPTLLEISCHGSIILFQEHTELSNRRTEKPICVSIKPISAKWTYSLNLLVSIGPAIFILKDIWVVYFFHFTKFLIEHSVNKQWRPWSDAAFCGV